MKSIFKSKSKKGFTLVEVMLSVAIMAVASLMIMEGFMATMNLAQNTSVYNKIGGTNYRLAAEKISYYTSLPAADTSADGRYALLAGDSSSNKTYNISIAHGVAGVSAIQYTARGWRFTSAGSVNSTDASHTNLVNFDNEDYAGSFGSYSVNRTTFFYSNTWQCGNPECDSYGAYGCVRHGVKSGVSGWYCVDCEELVYADPV